MKPTGPPLKRALVRRMMAMTWRRAQQDIDDFRDQIEADLAGRGSPQVSLTPTVDDIRSQAAASLEESG